MYLLFYLGSFFHSLITPAGRGVSTCRSAEMARRNVKQLVERKRGQMQMKWKNRCHACLFFLKSRVVTSFANLAWKFQRIYCLVGRLTSGKITINNQSYRKVKCGPRYGWATKSVSTHRTNPPAEIVKMSRGNTASVCQFPCSEDCPTVTRRPGVKGICEVSGPATSL